MRFVAKDYGTKEKPQPIVYDRLLNEVQSEWFDPNLADNCAVDLSNEYLITIENKIKDPINHFIYWSITKRIDKIANFIAWYYIKVEIFFKNFPS